MADMVHEAHPENDLLDDVDFYNRQPPEPESVDELADAPDPLVVREKNRRSSRNAFRYGVVAFIVSIVFAIGLAVAFRLSAGAETCRAAHAKMLCTQDYQKWWGILIPFPPIIALAGSMVVMVRTLNRYLRWRPWMGVFWALLPLSMYALTICVQMVLSEDLLF